MPTSSMFFLVKARSFFKVVRTKHGERALVMFSCKIWPRMFKGCLHVHCVWVGVELASGDTMAGKTSL